MMALLRKKSLTTKEIAARIVAGTTLIFIIGALCGVFQLVLDLLQGKGCLIGRF
jgi:hypothetical protein